MCITLHWVDDDWCIQKRIVTFSHVEGRHTGVRLSEGFTTSMLRWFVEKKMFSLTLDNASANDVAVKDIISELKKHSPLVCNGMFFHVRCACHILNLVAKDGLQEIESTIEKIKSFVNAVKGSPLQWEELMKCASESGLDTTKGLLNDVSTRWNSTYLMLADAIYYRAAFDRLTSYDRRRYEKMCPSAAEWEKAMKIRAFLKRFFDLTELFSGTLYPTANLFYKGFCDIKIILTDWSKGKDSDITIRRMATAMLAKFDKYWNKSNTALAVASFLDPRFKMRIVQFCMEFIH